jgi:predicted PurR-regulated permease PerM
VALITKPLSSSTAVQEARHLALPVIAMGVIAAVLYFGRIVFVTALIAVIIAFILEPFVALLMRLRLPRSVSSFIVWTLALLFLYFIGMGAYAQISGLSGYLPKYGQRIGDIVEGVRGKLQSIERSTYSILLPAHRKAEEKLRAEQEAAAAKQKKGRKTEPPPALPPPVQEEQAPPRLGDYIYSRLSSFYQIFLMASFIPFLVYFMLSWRDHINRSFLQFFQGEDRLVAARSLSGIAEMVRAFVVGNFLLGLLLASLSALAFWLIDLPYPLLVGPLSGFFSLVPYVGLPLALAPPIFAALPLNSFSTYVLVFVIATLLHLIALNLLYPKIVGSRVHLNPLVVTFSLMFWGFLWDAPGLILAIPLTAGIKAVCDNVKDLRPFGKFLGD